MSSTSLGQHWYWVSFAQRPQCPWRSWGFQPPNWLWAFLVSVGSWYFMVQCPGFDPKGYDHLRPESNGHQGWLQWIWYVNLVTTGHLVQPKLSIPATAALTIARSTPSQTSCGPRPFGWRVSHLENCRRKMSPATENSDVVQNWDCWHGCKWFNKLLNIQIRSRSACS